MKGFHNRVLTVDLSDQTFSVEDLSNIPLDKTLGGKGLGSHLLMEKNIPGCDPLSPAPFTVAAGTAYLPKAPRPTFTLNPTPVEPHRKPSAAPGMTPLS